MKETITPEMIAKCQEIIKAAPYDGNKLEVETGPFAPCSVTSMLFPEIIDMALEHLKRKASHSLLEFIEEESKTNNIEVVIGPGAKITKKMKNHNIIMHIPHEVHKIE